MDPQSAADTFTFVPYEVPPVVYRLIGRVQEDPPRYKVYVGSTRKGVEVRFAEHQSAYRKWVRGGRKAEEAKGTSIRVLECGAVMVEVLERLPMGSTAAETLAREEVHIQEQRARGGCVNQNRAAIAAADRLEVKRSAARKYWWGVEDEVEDLLSAYPELTRKEARREVLAARKVEKEAKKAAKAAKKAAKRARVD